MCVYMYVRGTVGGEVCDCRIERRIFVVWEVKRYDSVF